MTTLETTRHLWDVRRAAGFLGVSRGWLYRHLDEVPCFRIGGVLRFDPDEMVRYLEAHREDNS